MSLILLGIGAAYLYLKSQNSVVYPGTMKPTNPGTLPPINRLAPSMNDTIRPKAWTYDPRKIGYTERINGTTVKGDYSIEKVIGPEAASKSNALHRRQRVQDIFVQQQSAYIPEHFLMDPVYWKTGVHPFTKINSLGFPRTRNVPPVSASPVQPN